MATYAEQLQAVWREYIREHGEAATAREVVQWGVARGLIRFKPADPFAAMAEDLARALREETAVDENGRRYRLNHAVRLYRDGAQYTVWGIIDDAPPDFMGLAFKQRREQIIGDCIQLAMDVAHYNDILKQRRSRHQPIQLSFDFTEEVERRLSGHAEAA
jgi:hypothetical protein